MKILEGKYRKKSDMIAYFKANSNLFPSLVQSSLSTKGDLAWRSALLVGHLIQKDDPRIVTYLNQYINILPKVTDGHQRQILVILDKMNFDDNQEGKLFDYCLAIWESIQKIPSTRIRAFWMMEKIAKKYPELEKELVHFVSAYYIETLSAGIKNYLIKRYS